jgi:hypothetical protein
MRSHASRGADLCLRLRGRTVHLNLRGVRTVQLDLKVSQKKEYLGDAGFIGGSRSLGFGAYTRKPVKPQRVDWNLIFLHIP